MSFHQRQVEPHLEGGVLSGPFHCIPGKGLSHHQACRCENALLVRFDNGLIDRQCQAEIIPGNYDSFQFTFRAAAKSYL